MFRRPISWIIIVTFFFSLVGPYQPASADILNLPAPGSMVNVSPAFEPALIKGLTVHKENPFLFDFIVDPGQSKYSQSTLKEQSDRMIKYFFAALTVPDKDVWVNLSPYEKDRMVTASLGQTAMGRDLLAQDYLLKQLTASLIYPQNSLGKSFWATVYSKAQAMYGTTQIPVNTFNKVWIVPQRAGVYEHGQTAFIVDSHLKVMLEEDYLSLKKHIVETPFMASPNRDAINRVSTTNNVHTLGSQIIRQIILPEIEKEVNEGQNFATLRQIFYAQVLAVWFKHNLKQALINQVYANKSTVKGIDQNTAATNAAIYQQYLRAYKKGVFNYIKEDIDPVTQETLPRKYFSGGYAMIADNAIVRVKFLPNGTLSPARPAQFVQVLLVVNNKKEATALAENVAEDEQETITPEALAPIAVELGLPVNSDAFKKAVQNMPRPDPNNAMTINPVEIGHWVLQYGPKLAVGIGMGVLGFGLQRGHRLLGKAKEALRIEAATKDEEDAHINDTITYLKKMDKNYSLIIGPIFMLVGLPLFGHQPGVSQVWVNKFDFLLGMMITGGKNGYGPWVKEMLATAIAARDAKTEAEREENLTKLRGSMNFEGNELRWGFYWAQYYIYVAFAALWLTQNPTDYPTGDFKQWIISAAHLGAGVVTGISLAKLEQWFGKNGTIETPYDNHSEAMTAVEILRENRHLIKLLNTEILTSVPAAFVGDTNRETERLANIKAEEGLGKLADTLAHLYATSEQEEKKIQRDIKLLIHIDLHPIGRESPVIISGQKPRLWRVEFSAPESVMGLDEEIIREQIYPKLKELSEHTTPRLTPSQLMDLFIKFDKKAVGSDYTFTIAGGNRLLSQMHHIFLEAGVYAPFDPSRNLKDIGEIVRDMDGAMTAEKEEVVRGFRYMRARLHAGRDFVELADNEALAKERLNRFNALFLEPLIWQKDPRAGTIKHYYQFRAISKDAPAVLATWQFGSTVAVSVVPALDILGIPQTWLSLDPQQLTDNLTELLKRELQGARPNTLINPDDDETSFNFDALKQRIKKVTSAAMLGNLKTLSRSFNEPEVWRPVTKRGRVVKEAHMFYSNDGRLSALTFGEFTRPITLYLSEDGTISWRKTKMPPLLWADLQSYNASAAMTAQNPILKRQGLLTGVGEGAVKKMQVPGMGSAMHKINLNENRLPFGGIDLSEADAAMRVTKDADGGVVVQVDPALIARVERNGISEAFPVIINMKPADLKSLFQA